MTTLEFTLERDLIRAAVELQGWMDLAHAEGLSREITARLIVRLNVYSEQLRHQMELTSTEESREIHDPVK